eukprot:scaffold149718_cov22-Prasinocladus_malaysianus.AAC.1
MHRPYDPQFGKQPPRCFWMGKHNPCDIDQINGCPYTHQQRHDRPIRKLWHFSFAITGQFDSAG